MVPKINDIAKYAGVSPSTVSRVLHGTGYVSQEKRERVEVVLKKFNYVPNQVARGLKQKETRMIGHILKFPFPNPFGAEVTRGVELEADENEYHILNLFSYGDQKREERLIQEMASRMVDGVVFTGKSSAASVKCVMDMGIPVVMVERPMGELGVDTVLVDYVEGSRMATKHLIDRNHRNIAYLGVHPNENVESQRFQGFLSALKQAGITPNDEWIHFEDDYTPEHGVELAKALLQSRRLPSAILVSSDMLVIGVLQVLYELQLRVPDDISIIAYDDSFSGILAPKISTIRVPMRDLGRIAVRMLVERIADKDSVSKTVITRTSLVDRGSVRAI